MLAFGRVFREARSEAAVLPVTGHTALRLRLAHGGKAQALSVAPTKARSELVLTVDAETLLEPEALGQSKRNYAASSLSRAGPSLQRSSSFTG